MNRSPDEPFSPHQEAAAMHGSQPVGTSDCGAVDTSGGSVAADELQRLLSYVTESLSVRERGTLVQFLSCWTELPAARRAALAKTLLPNLKDEGVAALAGVSRRTLLRDPAYRRLKAQLRAFQMAGRSSARSHACDDDADIGEEWP